MKYWIKHIVLALLLFGSSLYSQTQKQLESKRKAVDKKIQEYNSLLKDISGDKKRSEISFVLLNKKLTAREALINYYNQEVALLNAEIEKLSESKEKKEADLAILKKEYADMLYYAYKNRSSYDKLSFIFSSDDFSQAYRRLKYIQDYALYRQEQVRLINKAKTEIELQMEELSSKREEKQQLIIDKQAERDQLSIEQTEKKQLYEELRSKEQEIKKKLLRKKKERADLNKAIEELIRKLASKGTESNKIPMSPAEKELAASFASNKGKLPWPSMAGLITRHFGTYRHEIQKVEIINNGIDILVRKGETARAVFDGVVEGVIILPGNKYSVLVRHGNYFTVYSNLQKPYVNNGDKVSTKETIGMVKTTDEGTVLHFEVWKSSEVVNPESWILPRR